MEVTLHENERLDELHRNGYKIIQDKGRFCFGMDAVLLSGFARVKPGEKVLDLGISQISGGSRTSVGGYAVWNLECHR